MSKLRHALTAALTTALLAGPLAPALAAPAPSPSAPITKTTDGNLQTSSGTVTVEHNGATFIAPAPAYADPSSTAATEFDGNIVETNYVAFRDISRSPFVKEINWLKDSGITTGYSDGTFRPGASMDRGMMAAFLYRLAGEPAYTAPAESTFADLTPRTAFYKEIHWMADQGITNGWAQPSGKPVFRPTSPVKRDQMAAFLYRYNGSAAPAPATPMFKDVSANQVFAKEIAWLAQSGVSKGWSDGTYRPGQDITRDQMAAFLYRYAHQVAE